MAVSTHRAAPRRVGIVVPAKDEQQTIGTCLASIAEAACQIRLPVRVMAVLDNCSDGSADIVRRFASTASRIQVEYVEVTAGSVGRARRIGMAALISRLGRTDTWLATTDADSTVPRHWLFTQLRHALRGAEVVVGTVAVDDWRERPPGLRDRAIRQYADNPYSHRHVHGANLSFSAAAYLAAGGFPDQPCGEDVALVRAFQAKSQRIAWAIDLAVTTSARRDARAPGGFADYLTALESETS